jgi:hypothetical protein
MTVARAVERHDPPAALAGRAADDRALHPSAPELHHDGTRLIEMTHVQRGIMTEEKTVWESIKVEGGQLLDQVTRLVHEGNVRRIVIKQKERTVVEFPLSVGLVGAIVAPVLAAVGAIAALLTDCSIEVERAAVPAPPPAAEEPPTK